MEKLFSSLSLLFLFSFLHAQTCVGTFNFKLFDQKTKKPVTEKLQKNIVCVFTREEGEFYDDIETVLPLDSIRKVEGYHIRENEKGYGFFNNTDPSAISFATYCGLYLIRADFFGKKDTMSLSFYNIPAHQSFQIDTVIFQKGDYFIDLQASTRFSDFSFVEDKGYFLIPRALLLPVPKAEEKK